MQVYLAVPDNRPLKDAVHAKDGRLWGVDDGRPKEGTKDTTVADRESSAVHVLN